MAWSDFSKYIYIFFFHLVDEREVFSFGPPKEKRNQDNFFFEKSDRPILIASKNPPEKYSHFFSPIVNPNKQQAIMQAL